MQGRGNIINVSSYVALGDSLASGYTDGALCYHGQLNSYPNLIAAQFKLIGGGKFIQPLVNVDSVGIGFSGNSCLVLRPMPGSSEPTAVSLAYLDSKGDLSSFLVNNYKTHGPFHNMGVPGIKVTALLKPGLGDPSSGPGNYNPFFTRMASHPAKASVLSDALALKPTFFSLFIGNNDALAFALTGGTADSITPPYGEAGIGFDGSIRMIIDSLMANGAKGVIANIPDINSVPFFTALPYNGLVIDANAAEILNVKYNSGGIHFSPGKNAFVIDTSYTEQKQIRKIEKGEMILSEIVLDPSHHLYLTGMEPIPKKYVLTLPEIQKIQMTIREYNLILGSIATEKDLALVNVNALLKSSRSNMIYDPNIHNFIYKKRGVYSLDGLHPNALGQALLANEFIKAINEKYGSWVPLVKSIKYKRKIMRAAGS